MNSNITKKRVIWFKTENRMDGSTNHREYRKKNISFHSKVSSLHYDLTKEISINPIIPRIILAFPDECPLKDVRLKYSRDTTVVKKHLPFVGYYTVYKSSRSWVNSGRNATMNKPWSASPIQYLHLQSLSIQKQTIHNSSKLKFIFKDPLCRDT